MILRSQIPLGQLRVDDGATLLTLEVQLGKPKDLFKVNVQTIVYGESSIVVTLNTFIKLLYEGSTMAHSALWSPYYTGDLLPKEDLLNDNLVRSLLEPTGSLYKDHLNWRHAQDVANKRKFQLERDDWEFLSQRFSERPEIKPLPPLGTDPAPFNKVIEQYYGNYHLHIR